MIVKKCLCFIVAMTTAEHFVQLSWWALGPDCALQMVLLVLGALFPVDLAQCHSLVLQIKYICCSMNVLIPVKLVTYQFVHLFIIIFCAYIFKGIFRRPLLCKGRLYKSRCLCVCVHVTFNLELKIILQNYIMIQQPATLQ